MKNFNYKYVVTPTKVIALSTYAGRTVRGIAKCHPNDIFNEEFGKRLAAARCNEKIAEKRYNRARKKYNDCTEKILQFDREFRDVCEYLENAYQNLKDARNQINEF